MHQIFGGGNSSTSSAPVDMTPAAFSAMQGPLANALMLLGGTGGPVYGGGNSYNSPFSFATPATNFGYNYAPGTPGATGGAPANSNNGPSINAGVPGASNPGSMFNSGGMPFNPAATQGSWTSPTALMSSPLTLAQATEAGVPYGGQMAPPRTFSVGGAGGNPDAGAMPSVSGSVSPSVSGNAGPFAAAMPAGGTAGSPTGAAPAMGVPGAAGAPGATPTAAPGTGAGAFTAGLSPAESNLLSTIYGFGSPTSPTSAAGGFLQGVLNPNYPGTLATAGPVQAAIQAATNPLITAFNETTMPSLKGQFAAGGHVLNGPGAGPNGADVGGGSSPFSHAAALAETGFGQNIASTAANISNSAFQTGLQQQTQAATQAPALQSSEVQNLVSTLQAEALPRLIDQYGLDQGLQEFNNRINVMLQSLGLAAGKAGPDIANSAQGRADQETGVIPALGQLAGGIGGAMGSDIRFKTDVERVGTTLHGLPLYTFRYRGRSERFEGVMAHDVLRVKPEAVVFDEHGYAYVNYDTLGIPFRMVEA